MNDEIEQDVIENVFNKNLDGQDEDHETDHDSEDFSSSESSSFS